MTQVPEFWNTVYDNDTAPWLIGEPQPAIVGLEAAGLIRGRVLDPGCGGGEHTILLTRLGYDVLGVDLSPSAVDYARRNAAEKGAAGARFQVVDMLRIGADAEAAGALGRFDTIVDSALFHVFREDAVARAAYVDALSALTLPGSVVHLLALSNAGPGFGPRISDTVIRESFTTGWDIEELRATSYRGRADVVPAETVGLPVAADGTVEGAAWLARIRRR
ncbi:class I SAM-dependent methyltransferase [Nocardia sp. alder85J]|uniref:class I SAM-dependent methyltransferase n=1 Tax=Nocardia sp. alder85J TaxID=2862949 RepID=UPI001CD736F3|nr:class I SAM-dependent methyltransferase [Nocardia sp. alder85J]MCX4097466.1 class I SAM-dependent methyltransferase [Nocardia sp. alder85J]